jgi:serine phosphatase RsbU (regulator of sigma subunit)
VLFLLLDQVPESHRLRVASGGHPLPLCRRADGGLQTLGRPSSFLGMEQAIHVSESSAFLTPGDMVVLYTDGVTEARHGDAFFGEPGIASVLAAERVGGLQTLNRLASSLACLLLTAKF